MARIDLAGYLRRRRDLSGAQCVQLDRDLEYLIDRLLRREGSDRYLPPLLVGTGRGAGLVRQVLDSADPNALTGAIVDAASAPAQLPQCADGVPDQRHGFLIAAGRTTPALARTAAAHLPMHQNDALAGLPLVELPVPGSHRLAILISGDGGWHSLDKGVASQLRRAGVSVLGWNSRRYFWAPKTPEQAAADLARVITSYRGNWHADEVALVGYSFGADVLPFLYNRLPPELRPHIRMLALMGTAPTADFQVHIVRDWLTARDSDGRPTLPEIARVPPQRMLCVYGIKEKHTICPQLRARGIEVLATPGGHHFDHDPAKLAAHILARWQAAPPVPS